MADVSLDFKQALLLDMERKDLTERALGQRLGITQQAVHRWIERGYPPLSRLDALVAVLGPDSEVGKLSKDAIYSSNARTIRSAMIAPLVLGDGPMSDAYSQYYKVIKPVAAIAKSGDPSPGEVYKSYEEINFKAELTPAMRNCVEKRVKLPSGQTFTFDYLSDTLVAELTYVQQSHASSNTGNSVLRMLTLARAVNPALRMLLIVVSQDHKVNLPTHVVAAAEAFGVEIKHARSGVEAAHIVALVQEAADTVPVVSEPDE